MICPATLGNWKCIRPIGHEHEHLHIDADGVKSTWAPKQPPDVPVLPTPIAIDRSYLEDQVRQQEVQVDQDARNAAALDEGKGTAAENRAETTANFDQIPESIGEKEFAVEEAAKAAEEGNAEESDAARMVREAQELQERVDKL